MRAVWLALVVSLLAILVGGSAAFAQVAPGAGTASPTKAEFRLGFKALADQLPDVAGQPVEDEQWGDNGDSLQRTTTGLMVWRKADNWTAFTNGSRTWVNGPFGIQDRDNGDRFAWEVPEVLGPPDPNEIVLYDRRNIPTAYIAVDDENTIYMWTGEPVAYLYGEHIYGFNGRHLGWFEEATVWDWETVAVGFTRESLGGLAGAEPIKSPRLAKPDKLPREEAPPQRSKAFVFTKMLATVLRLGEIQ